MATCQRCGRYVPASQRLYRRQLYNGTTHRVNYGRRVYFGTSDYYAVKNVCSICVDEIDRDLARRKTRRQIKWLVIFILIVSYFLFKKS